MSAAERQEFLAGVHVGVLTAAIGIAGQTLAVPVWYSYQPGRRRSFCEGQVIARLAACQDVDAEGMNRNPGTLSQPLGLSR